MAKYFKNIKSFEELKKQYRDLLKKNHPDNGGDLAAMQDINAEYDALFAIWKNRHETSTGETVKETAESTRRQFYTENGWEGSNHSWNRSLKEVAQIVRAYVKEKYPTYKFSVRTSYASMCQSLHVELKESPIEVYKTFEELTEGEKHDLMRRMRYNDLFTLDSWYEHELKAEFERIWSENGDFYKCLNEATQSVIDDVDSFVKSYNYSDCDGMIDYFDVDFYYFGCAQNNGINIKVVPKTPRIKNKATKPATATNSAPTAEKTAKKANTAEIEQKSGYTYKITKGEDSRDGSELWIVRIVENLTKDEYIAENKKMKERGSYYSRFLHGFIFRFDPTEKLTGGAAA